MTTAIRRPTLAALAAVAFLLLTSLPVGAAAHRTYEVTIRNLTGGQALTPPLIATHRGSAHLFQVGTPANAGTQQIAENGNLDPLVAALEGNRNVWEVVTGTAPLVPPGSPQNGMFSDRVTLTVSAGPGAQFLSYESMLICTNDGFTGIDAVKLPNRIGSSTTVHAAGYDAGTEVNTEDFADIVPPCQALIGVGSSDPGTGTSDPALAEGGVIRHHPGIAGGDDLVPAIHGWADPVVAITIVRVG